MLYAIGISEFDFVKFAPQKIHWVDEKGEMKTETDTIKLMFDIPQSTATLFNNKTDAFDVLDELKEMKDRVVIESFLLEPSNITVDDLNIYELSPKKVER
jgi:hypothetical protein